jgi:hypothetical protein
LINKRREHGLETWVLFLDLVKAFDRVPRCAEHTLPRNQTDPAEAAKNPLLGMLWRVMSKYGVAPKLVRLLIAMHKKVLVKFDVDGVMRTLDSVIGVKQGDLLGPPLFIFYIAAIMETWRSEHSYELCVFRSRPDFKMTGRRSTTGSAEDEFIDSEYADDTGLPFPSREVVEEQTPYVLTHFGRWGMWRCTQESLRPMRSHVRSPSPRCSSALLRHAATWTLHRTTVPTSRTCCCRVGCS